MARKNESNETNHSIRDDNIMNMICCGRFFDDFISPQAFCRRQESRKRSRLFQEDLPATAKSSALLSSILIFIFKYTWAFSQLWLLVAREVYFGLVTYHPVTQLQNPECQQSIGVADSGPLTFLNPGLW